MTAQDLVDALAARGLTAVADGDQLRIQGQSEQLDPDLIARLREHKQLLLAHLRATGVDEAGAAGADGAFPLTEMQQAYVLGRAAGFEIGGVSSHVYHEIETAGLDAARLSSALQVVIRKHPALRTRVADDGTQTVVDARDIPRKPIKVYDFRVAEPARRISMVETIRAEMSHQVMPLDRPPFIDIRLAHMSDENQRLFVSHDGLTMDGISMEIFFRDWFDAYLDPACLRDEPAVTFRDHVLAARKLEAGPAYERARRYWFARIDQGLPPHPQLPLARDPSSIVNPRLVRHEVELEREAYQRFRAQAQLLGLTPTAALFAAYCEVLAGFGGGHHFSLSLSFANRLPIHPAIGDVMGNFTSILWMEVDGREAATFAERAQRIQRRLREDLDHRFFSGLQVQRELRRREENAPVRLPITFNSALDSGAGDPEESPIERFGTEVFGVSQTPQVWLNAFVLARGGGAVVQLDAVDGLFPEGLVEAVADACRRLLHQLCNDDAGWHQYSFPVLPEVQRRRRRKVNGTSAPIAAALLHDGFLTRAKQAPTAVAIRTTRRSVTYRELDELSSAVACWLRDRSAGRNALVGVVMRKGWEQVAALLGALRAGVAYLPIDPAVPPARRSWLLDNGDVRCVLTTSDLAEAEEDTLFVDRLAAAPAIPDTNALPDDLAYVIYTSGTSGTPKGVMVSHRSAVNLVTDINRRFEVGTSDVVLAFSNASFDLSVYDIFGTLAAGATLAIPDWDKIDDPAHLLSFATESNATIWNSVPAAAQMLLEQCEGTRRPLPPTLRLMWLSGDRIPPELPSRVQRLHTDVAVHSLGGPTETTVWNITYPISRSGEPPVTIPYGKPIANSRYYVLDHRLEECPDWVTGTLYAAGAGLSAGYWKDRERTRESFFVHHGLRERLYRTGDLGRYLPDGNIEISGRADAQIKLNGYRVEPGEVEAHIGQHPAIRQCAVVCTDPPAEKSLVAFLAGDVDAGQRAAVETQLRASLGESLPAYMVPARFLWRDAIPLTPNGKVDRRGLAAAEATSDELAAPDFPGSGPAELMDETEQRVAALWCQVLKREAVSANQEFARLGGDSIAAARLSLALRKEFGVSAPLVEIMRQRTVRALSTFIRTRQEQAQTAAPLHS